MTMLKALAWKWLEAGGSILLRNNGFFMGPSSNMLQEVTFMPSSFRIDKDHLHPREPAESATGVIAGGDLNVEESRILRL